AALVIETGLQRMRSDNLADVVINVEGRVGIFVGVLAVAGYAAKVRVRDTPEGNVEPLRGRVARERQRKIEADARIAGRIRHRRVERQVILARAEDELVGQRWRERGRYVERAVPCRRLFEDQVVERNLVVASRPAQTVRHDLLVGVACVADISLCVVRQIVIDPDAGFFARVADALLRVVVVSEAIYRAAQRRVIELPEEVQDLLAIRIDKVGRDLIVREGQACSRVRDDDCGRARSGVTVSLGLAEITSGFQRCRYARLARGLRYELLLPFLREEEEKALFQVFAADLRQPDRAADIVALLIVAIEVARVVLNTGRIATIRVVEKRIGVELLVTV